MIQVEISRSRKPSCPNHSQIQIKLLLYKYGIYSVEFLYLFEYFIAINYKKKL